MKALFDYQVVVFFRGVHVSQFGPLFLDPFGVGSEIPCPAELPTYIVYFFNIIL